MEVEIHFVEGVESRRFPVEDERERVVRVPRLAAVQRLGFALQHRSRNDTIGGGGGGIRNRRHHTQEKQ